MKNFPGNFQTFSSFIGQLNSLKNSFQQFLMLSLSIVVLSLSYANESLATSSSAPSGASANAACGNTNGCANPENYTCTSISNGIPTGTTCSSGDVVSNANICACKLKIGQACTNATDCSIGLCSSGLCQSSGSQAAISVTGNEDRNALVTVLCKAYLIANGAAGKTVAAFAIISAGIGFFTGKVSWGLLIGIAIGIGTMFGAPTIVSAISGTSYDTSTCKNANNVYNK